MPHLWKGWAFSQELLSEHSPSQKGKGKGKGGKRGVLSIEDGAPEEEMEVSGLWEIMCIEPVPLTTLTEEASSLHCELLVDSGAYAHVCPADFAPAIPLESCQLPLVSTADGTKMTPLGKERKQFPVSLRMAPRLR